MVDWRRQGRNKPISSLHQIEVGQIEVGQIEVGQIEVGQIEVGQTEVRQIEVGPPAVLAGDPSRTE